MPVIRDANIINRKESFDIFLFLNLKIKGKCVIFALKIKGNDNMISIEDKIHARIIRRGRGWAMTNRDFIDLANASTVDWSLYKLKAKDIIRPILRGIYDYPKYSELLQEKMAPDLNSVAQAIARKNQWHIQISGSAALNFLGLSTQIPMSTIFYSDGPNRVFFIEERKLQFKHKALKEAKIASAMSEIIVQALSELGEEHISEETIKIIRTKISDDERKKLWNETQYIRSWIRSAIERICQEGDATNG
jgi:hypothetical protein